MRNRIMKKSILYLYQSLEWMAALVIVFFIFNIGIMSFYHPASAIVTNNAAVPEKFFPGDWCLYGDEGYGLEHIDENGYVNPDLPLSDSFVLAVGSSHTEGFHTSFGKRWTDIMNKELGAEDQLMVYNIGHSGYRFPQIAKRFSAIVGEFPTANAIVIEIADTDYAIEGLLDSLNQVEYNESDLMKEIYGGMTYKTKIKYKVKSSVPVLRLLHKQIEVFKDNHSVVDLPTDSDIMNDEENYINALNLVMQKMREIYQKQIIIVYHPPVDIGSDGDMIINSDRTSAMFEECCKENNIDFVNLGNAFNEAYMQDFSVPYGFFNTSMGQGHLNDCGQKIFAEEVMKVLKVEEYER